MDRRILRVGDRRRSTTDPEPRSPSFRIPWKEPAFCGVFSKDSSKLIVSSGDAGHGIQVFPTHAWNEPAKKRLEVRDVKPIATIRAHDDAYINDIVLTPDEHFAFGAGCVSES